VLSRRLPLHGGQFLHPAPTSILRGCALRGINEVQAIHPSGHLFGQRIAVAPQTVAEARCRALSSGWGAARMERLSRLIARARVLPVDIDTIEVVAKLRNECRQIGHGLHQRGHNAYLWIAATAIRWRVPLGSGRRPRLGFSPARVAAHLDAGSKPGPPLPAPTRDEPHRRRRVKHSATVEELLNGRI
jgi:predicted nucleic acid-binding protein